MQPLHSLELLHVQEILHALDLVAQEPLHNWELPYDKGLLHDRGTLPVLEPFHVQESPLVVSQLALVGTGVADDRHVVFDPTKS